MKFTTTYNYTWRAGIGNIPKAWIDYGIEDHKDSIWKYFYDKIELLDFDVCGNETHDFVFEDGKAYRLEYAWWRDDWAEEDESCLKNEVYIEEISIDAANVPDRNIGRDWL
jgi:hypothetical protein